MLRVQDTPSLSPHRRSDTLPGVAELDARNFQITARYQLPLIDESFRLRTSGPPLNRSHRHDPAGTSGLDGGRPRRPGASRPRRNSRDQDLRHPREHAYGPRTPLVRPGERQSVYDWAPVPPPVPPASAPPGIDDEPTSRSLPPLLGYEDDLPRYFPFTSRDFSAMLEAGGIRLMGEAQRSRYSDLFGGGGGGGGASNSSSSSATTTTSTSATVAPVTARNTNRRITRPRVYWPDPAISLGRDHQARERMMDDADTDAILRSRFSRIRPGHEGSLDSRLPEASKEVEKAIEYLSKVRGCRTPQESLRLAVRLGFHSGDDWSRLFDEQPKCDDLVLDTSFLRVAETSWLEAGGVFWGSQIAPTMSPTYETSSTRSIASSSGSTSSQWTVKLSISSIDYRQLRLSKFTSLTTGIPIPLRERHMADKV